MGSFSRYAGPPPIVTHLHGGAVPSAFDGNSESWLTPGQAKTGPGFTTNVCHILDHEDNDMMHPYSPTW